MLILIKRKQSSTHGELQNHSNGTKQRLVTLIVLNWKDLKIYKFT